jgi:hypothetical protein
LIPENRHSEYQQRKKPILSTNCHHTFYLVRVEKRGRSAPH